MAACTAHSDVVCKEATPLSCEVGWTRAATGQCFRILKGSLAFHEAASECFRVGGTLAAARDVGDVQALLDLCPLAVGSFGCWVGLRFSAEAGSPVWTQPPVNRDPVVIGGPGIWVGSSTDSATYNASCYAILPVGEPAIHEWTLSNCSVRRAALCSRPANTGINISTVTLQCASPGCTASGIVADYAADEALVAAATLTVTVQQIDLAAPGQRIADVVVDGVRAGGCEGGRGGDTCSLIDWLACGPALDVDVSPDTPTSVSVVASASVGTPCYDDVVVAARAHLSVAAVDAPAEVVPWLSRVTGNSATVRWKWPHQHGGSPVDVFSVSLGGVSQLVAASAGRISLTRALHAAQVVKVVSAAPGEALTATCSLNKVVMWGFSLHLPGQASPGSLSTCAAANNRACTPRQSGCAQSACPSDGHSAYRVVYIVCQTPGGVPTWATAANQQFQLTADAFASDSRLSCSSATTAGLLGFSIVRSLTGNHHATTACARSGSFGCPVGSASCVRAQCAPEPGAGSVPSAMFLVCAPKQLLVDVGATSQFTLAPRYAASLTCPPGKVVAWGAGFSVGYASFEDQDGGEGVADGLLSTASCDIGGAGCALEASLGGDRMLVVTCVEESALTPTFQTTFFGVSGLVAAAGNAVPVHVTATNVAGFAATSTADVRLGLHTPSSPSEPGALTLVAASGGRLQFTWAAPLDNGGQSVSSYDVILVPGVCPSADLLVSAGLESDKALTGPAWTTRVAHAVNASAGASRWPLWTRAVGSASVGLVSVSGIVGGWRPVATVFVDAHSTVSEVDFPVCLQHVGSMRVVFPVCDSAARIAEIDVIDQSGHSIALGRPAVAGFVGRNDTNSRAFGGSPSFVTDGACWAGCDGPSGGAGAWSSVCPDAAWAPWIAVRLSQPSTITAIRVLWSTLVAAEAAANAGPLRIEIASGASAHALVVSAPTAALALGSMHTGEDPAVEAAATITLRSPLADAAQRTADGAVDMFFKATVQTTEHITLMCNGALRLSAVLLADGRVRAVDTGPMEAGPPQCLRWAETPGAVALSSWHHVVVSRSTADSSAPGLIVDGMLAAEWQTVCDAAINVDVPGHLRVTFSSLPAVAAHGLWAVTNQGRSIELATAIPSHAEASVRAEMDLVSRYLAGAATLVASSSLTGPTWHNVDASVTIKAAAGGNGVVAMSVRYINEDNQVVVAVGYTCNCVEVWRIQSGTSVLFGHADLGATSLELATMTTWTLRVVLSGNVVTTRVEGALVLTATLHSTRTAHTTASIGLGVADMPGGFSDLRVVDLSTEVHLGVASRAAQSQFYLLVQHVTAHANALSVATSHTLAQAAVHSAWSGSPLATSQWGPPSPSTNESTALTGDWMLSASVRTGKCNVVTDGDVGTRSVHVIGSGGNGFMGAAGTLTPPHWVRRRFNAGGRQHSHARVRLSVGYVGIWRWGLDVVEVSVDDALQWQGVHSTVPACPANWLHALGFCYMATSSAHTWRDGMEQCHHGRTLSLGSEEEVSALIAAFPAHFGPDLGVWTGLNDIEVEGRYQWADGSTYTYRPWAVGTTPGGSSIDNDCTVLTGSGSIVAVDCGSNHFVVCKAPVNASHCAAAGGVKVVDVDIVVPHTADVVDVRVQVSAATPSQAAIVVIDAHVDYKQGVAAPVWQPPAPAASHTSGPDRVGTVSGLVPNTAYCVAVS